MVGRWRCWADLPLETNAGDDDQDRASETELVLHRGGGGHDGDGETVCSRSMMRVGGIVEWLLFAVLTLVSDTMALHCQ